MLGAYCRGDFARVAYVRGAFSRGLLTDYHFHMVFSQGWLVKYTLNFSKYTVNFCMC